MSLPADPKLTAFQRSLLVDVVTSEEHRRTGKCYLKGRGPRMAADRLMALGFLKKANDGQWSGVYVSATPEGIQEALFRSSSEPHEISTEEVQAAIRKGMEDAEKASKALLRAPPASSTRYR